MRKIFYNNIIAKILIWGKCHTAMVFGFILSKKKKEDPLTKTDERHENIHAEQYGFITAAAFILAVILNLLFGGAIWFYFVPVLYYVIYFIEAAISFVHHYFSTKKKDPGEAVKKAYYNSMFEEEAYEYEKDAKYIQRRKWFGWIKYFGKI